MKLIVIILSIVGLVFCTQAALKDDDSRVLAPEVFKAQLESHEGVLLDVRTPEEYKAGHLADAENLDFFHEAFRENLEKLDKSKTYFIYCRSGKRSGKTAAMMAEAGFQNVFDMKGGFLGWQSAGLPVEKD